MNGSVAVLLVNYNGEKYIGECIDSLRKQSYSKVDIIVIDNFSKDNSLKFIERTYPMVKIISLKENKGFTGGNNVGIRYALAKDYDFILLLNTDTVADTQLVEIMLKYADANTAVAPSIYSDKSRKAIWYSGGKLCVDIGECFNTYYKNQKDPIEVTYMVGCCMLLHRKIIEKIGLLDEDYFLYYEDGDLSIRMLLSNIKMVYVPNTWVWHKVQYRNEKNYVLYYYTRNHLLFIKKYSKYLGITPCKLLSENIKQIINNYKNENFYKNKYIWMGIIDYLLGKKGKRKGIERY